MTEPPEVDSLSTYLSTYVGNYVIRYSCLITGLHIVCSFGYRNQNLVNIRLETWKVFITYLPYVP